MGRQRAVIDPEIAKALAHPLRMQLLAILEERTASPTELAELIGVSLPRVSYHVRRLAAAELIELVGTRQRRGAVEHYYAAVPHEEGDDEVTAASVALAAATQRRSAARKPSPAVAVAASLANGSEKIPVVLDARGWQQLSQRIDLLREDIDHIATASRKRLEEEGGEEAVRGHAIVMLAADGAAAGG